MKFPKSLHAEGWDQHFSDATQPGAMAPSRYVHRHDALHVMAAPAGERAAAPVARAGQPRTVAWVVGLGATAAMAAFAISTFNRQAAPEEAALASQGVVQPEQKPETVVAQNDAAATAPQTPLEPDNLPATAAGLSPSAATTVAAARVEAPVPEKAQAQKPVADRPLPDKPVVARAEPRPEPVVGRLAEPEVPPPPPLQAAQLAVAQPAAEASAPEVDDPGISRQVRQALAADPVLGQASIQVSTQQGQVKLEGEVPDAASKNRATWLASGPVGVRAVDNRLVVPGAVVSMSAAMPLESVR